MLLEFRAENYKSFREEFVFSMIPAPKQKGLDYSIQKTKIGRNVYKALSSAVVYGPNASGKTNIIGAMDTFKAILLRGHIKNSEVAHTPNIASYALELIPCCFDQKASPIKFTVKFIERNMLIEYSLKFIVGRFMEKDSPREILDEALWVNNQLVFQRGEGIYFAPDPISSLMNESFFDNFESAMSIASNSLNKEELFLANGFKTIFSQKMYAVIANWVENKFMVVYRSDAVQTIRKFADPKDNTIYVEKTLTEAAKEFGIQSNALGYKVDKSGSDPTLYSILGENGDALPAEVFESYGTIRFVNEFPLVIRALLTGATLVMDEFDASIHPMALMNIISIFHNDDINKHHAQLIFNTHNPIFLSSDLFRRDEIKFVERRSDQTSVHYSLSDFKTYGKSGVRNGQDYMRNYFVNQFGAISNVDFSPIIENLMSKSEEQDNE